MTFIIFFLILFCSLAKANEPIKLSLNEAILLAVAKNPNVQSSRLAEVSQKFNLHVQEWAFYPHYALQASPALGQTRTAGAPYAYNQNYNGEADSSLLTPIGTKLTLGYTHAVSTHYNPGLSLQVVQPLMRGFGRPIVEASLYNARDSEIISRLNVAGVLQTTISLVINAYLNVVLADKTVVNDKEAVARALRSIEQTKLFIKAGRKARNELVTVTANLARAKAQLENDKNNLMQSRYALLSAIGLDPNTAITFANVNTQALINKYYFPSLEQTKEWVLQNDIQYQVDRITLKSTQRSLLVALDNTRWQVNLVANAVTGKGSGNGANAGFNSLWNGQNFGNSIGLSFQIPIDDQQAKQSVLNAKIALKQANLALLQEKWNKETNGINGWNNVLAAKRTLHFAEEAENLQNKTYHISFQKYLHGLIDGLELQSAELQLDQAKQTFLGAQINYIKALVNLDLLIGHTLKTWNIQLRR